MRVHNVTTPQLATSTAAAPAAQQLAAASFTADIAAIRAEAANAAAFAATGSCPWAGGKPPKG